MCVCVHVCVCVCVHLCIANIICPLLCTFIFDVDNHNLFTHSHIQSSRSKSLNLHPMHIYFFIFTSISADDNHISHTHSNIQTFAHIQPLIGSHSHTHTHPHTPTHTHTHSHTHTHRSISQKLSDRPLLKVRGSKACGIM